MASDNPFSPTFGASPPVLAGRGDILDDIDDALATGPTHPDYTVLFIGVRGSGKTVMLNATEDLARERGWLTISENASPVGLVHRLTAAAVTQLARLDGPGPARQVTGVSAAGFGVTLEHTGSSDASTDLRSVLTDLGAWLARSEPGCSSRPTNC